MSKKEKERKQTISCGGVIYRVVGSRIDVLLIKQFSNKDRWGIPKGHVNEGETLEECAVREVREETGIYITLEARLPDCFVNNKVEEKTVISWLAQPVGSHDPRIDDPDSEVADARWFPIDALPEIVVYQRSLLASAVNRVLESLNKAS